MTAPWHAAELARAQLRPTYVVLYPIGRERFKTSVSFPGAGRLHVRHQTAAAIHADIAAHPDWEVVGRVPPKPATPADPSALAYIEAQTGDDIL